MLRLWSSGTRRVALPQNIAHTMQTTVSTWRADPTGHEGGRGIGRAVCGCGVGRIRCECHLHPRSTAGAYTRAPRCITELFLKPLAGPRLSRACMGVQVLGPVDLLSVLATLQLLRHIICV